MTHRDLKENATLVPGLFAGTASTYTHLRSLVSYSVISHTLLVFVVGAVFSSTTVEAMNLLQPYDTLLRPPYERHKRYHFNMFLEGGFGAKSFDCDGQVASSLQIWQCQQDALAMLKGFDPSSPISILDNQINANDDGTRGHFAVRGNVDLNFSAAFDARFFFLNDWWISLLLPVYHMELKDFRLIDQTEDNSDADLRVKSLLTDNFAANVKRLGCLELGDWKRAGVGDFTVLLNWYRDFPQNKEVLKNARLNWRVGLGFPTGKRTDPDKIMALPFGYDGSLSIPFGLGLDLMFGRFLQAGVDVQLTQIFGNTHERRIKTDIDQTELFLLQKAEAYKDYGLTQRFNLYVKLDKFLGGFSTLVGYQFFKHGADHLALNSNCFSNQIANTAASLRDWTSHQVIINASYDFAYHTWLKKHVQPYISLYGRIPFNGKRFTGNRMLGFVVAIDF